jgi:hypothetical protein
MAALARQTIGLGNAITPVAAGASGDTAPVDTQGWFEVTIGGTATVVTLVVPGSVYGVARGDVVTASLSNTTRRFGPLVPDLADPSTGLITISTSQQTAVTVAWVGI